MAIAFHARSIQNFTGATTTHTLSHTVTGSDPFLCARYLSYENPGTVTATWNGDSMTQVGSTQTDSGAYQAVFYIAAPDTGTRRVDPTSNSSDGNLIVVSYTGVLQGISA